MFMIENIKKEKIKIKKKKKKPITYPLTYEL